MRTDLTDELDVATERLLTGESIPAILVDYPAQAETLTPLLKAAARLETLQPVEMPPHEVLQTDRREFLARVAEFQQQAVSPRLQDRLKEWIVHSLPWQSINLTYQRKEQWRMSTLLVKAMIIFSLAFGSLGGTAVLAAHSLPGSPVYPVKLAMEQTRLALTPDPVDQAKQHLVLAQVRTQEMAQLALDGDTPDEATQARLQQHLQQAYNLAAQAPEQEMLGLLNQAQQMLQTQEQQLAQVQTQAGQAARQALQQANGLLNQARQNAAAGLQDPQTFRWRYTHGRPVDAPPPPDQPAPGEPGGNPDCPNGDCEPVGDQHQHGPRPERPGPGEPGGNPDCPNGDCEPVGDQHQYGPQPEQPGPSEPGDNQDCPSDACDRIRNRHQQHYGQEPDYGPGTGMPGGNPDCPGNDCEPVGDQHQNGQGPAYQSNAGEPGGNPDGKGLHHGVPSSDQAGGQNGGNDADHGGSDDNNGGSDNGGGDNSGGDDGGGDNGGGGDGNGDNGGGDGGGSGGGNGGGNGGK